MPEVTVASRKWRRRTRSFSALCDNMLTLDRTEGLQDDPSKLNRFGVCAPECEICLTPFGSGVVSDLCNHFGHMKKSPEDEVVIPADWVAKFSGGPWVLTNNLTCNRTATSGFPTVPLISEWDGNSFIMRGTGSLETSYTWTTGIREIGIRSHSIEVFDANGVATKWIRASYLVSAEYQLKYLFRPQCQILKSLKFTRAQISMSSRGVDFFNPYASLPEFSPLVIDALLNPNSFSQAGNGEYSSVHELPASSRTMPDSHSPWNYLIPYGHCQTRATAAHTVVASKRGSEKIKVQITPSIGQNVDETIGLDERSSNPPGGIRVPAFTLQCESRF
jgi:hypothetical protein